MKQDTTQDNAGLTQDEYDLIKEDLEKALKHYEVGYAQWHDLAEAVRQSLRALGKQVARVPNEHYHWHELSNEEKKSTYQWMCCMCFQGVSESQDYCHECGQKIDWE